MNLNNSAMFILNMKEPGNDHEMLAVLIPPAVTAAAILIMYILYKLYF